MASESKKTVVVALGANVVIAVAKLIGGLVTGASALLAEAAHSLADTMNEVFLLISLRLGRREPDETHPFGYGKERFFWAFVAAIFIFVAGASFSIYQGLGVVLTGEDEGISNLGVSFAILAVAFVAEGTSFVRAFRQAAPDDAGFDEISQTLDKIRRSKDPTVKTVLFEDGAALTGLLIAAVGLGLYQVTGAVVWDGIASILIGVLLGWIAYALGRDVKALLLGEAASPAVRQTLRDVIGRFDAVDAVLEVLTMHLAPDQILVAARIDLADGIPGEEVERVATEIEEALRDAEPMVVEVFLDPTAHSAINDAVGVRAADESGVEPGAAQ
jgi:cation diffusion facilitator family transporter